MTRAMARPAGISTCRAHCQRTQAHHWRSFHTQNGPCRLGVANITEGTAKYFETNCLVVCVYFYSYPMAASGTGVKRGDGRPMPSDRPPRPSPAFRRLALHHPPRTQVGGAAPPGGRRRASRRSNSVRTLRGWLEPARGEFPASNWPLGPPPVPHAGFLGHWEAQKSVECIRCDFLRSGCD